MKSKNTNSKKWLENDLNIIKKYALANSEMLISNLLINIVVGHKRFRKPKYFFNKLGELLERSSHLCKSKFQKLEKMIYIDGLKIRPDYYDTFCWVRRLKKTKVDFNFERMSQKYSKDRLGQMGNEKKTSGSKSKKILKVHRKLNLKLIHDF
jgi:hypothetical protein